MGGPTVNQGVELLQVVAKSKMVPHVAVRYEENPIHYNAKCSSDVHKKCRVCKRIDEGSPAEGQTKQLQQESLGSNNRNDESFVEPEHDIRSQGQRNKAPCRC